MLLLDMLIQRKSLKKNNCVAIKKVDSCIWRIKQKIEKKIEINIKESS